MTRTFQFSMAVILAPVACGVGCTPATAPPAAAVKPAVAPAADHGHAHGDHHEHGAGPHDGTLVDWGGGRYHVEFTVDHDRREAVVYVLGGDEKTPAPVKADDGKILLTIREPAFQVELAARPLPGEAAGSASSYGGTHDNLGIVREFAGTISGAMDGTPFAGDFAEEPHGGHDHE